VQTIYLKPHSSAVSFYYSTCSCHVFRFISSASCIRRRDGSKTASTTRWNCAADWRWKTRAMERFAGRRCRSRSRRTAVDYEWRSRPTTRSRRTGSLPSSSPVGRLVSRRRQVRLPRLLRKQLWHAHETVSSSSKADVVSSAEQVRFWRSVTSDETRWLSG